MDSVTFEDWFIRHLLPILKKKAGKKVVLGDNLASHINQKVLEKCHEHNISFICLPANSTHILQPLDVAYFRPLKLKWRQDWKQSQIGRRLPTTPKDQFPSLLKNALNSLTGASENIIAGFRKTGIMPTNKDEPLSRLPEQDRIVNLDLITGTFVQKLEQARNEGSPVQKIAKKKKLNVPAGQSISAADIAEATSSGLTLKPLAKPKKRRQQSLDSTTSCSSWMSEVSSTQELPDDDVEFEHESQIKMDMTPQKALADQHAEESNTVDVSEESDEDLPLVSVSNKNLHYTTTCSSDGDPTYILAR